MLKWQQLFHQKKGIIKTETINRTLLTWIIDKTLIRMKETQNCKIYAKNGRLGHLKSCTEA